ncbi:MAG: hypothetical protein Q8L64_06360 [bacterium]|nr:hypothetical protein [bacterium]
MSNLTLTGGGYGVSARLPQAVNLTVLGSTYKKSDVMMPAKGVAIVSTGKSPIGTSFRVNMCTGYLGQFQSYVPALAQECPSPAAKLVAYGLGNDASCKAFVEKLPKCRAYNGSYPSNISAACRAFVSGELSYNSCVAKHQDSVGFYKDEWRLFLEEKDELWKQKGEIIRLHDRTGNAIDAVTY